MTHINPTALAPYRYIVSKYYFNVFFPIESEYDACFFRKINNKKVIYVQSLFYPIQY